MEITELQEKKPHEQIREISQAFTSPLSLQSRHQVQGHGGCTLWHLLSRACDTGRGLLLLHTHLPAPGAATAGPKLR